MLHVYTMDYYSVIEKKKNGPFVDMWMDLETVIQNEVSQKEKNKYCIVVHKCGIKKNGINYLICKAEIETQIQRTKVWTPSEEQGEQDELGD